VVREVRYGQFAWRVQEGSRRRRQGGSDPSRRGPGTVRDEAHVRTRWPASGLASHKARMARESSFRGSHAPGAARRSARGVQNGGRQIEMEGHASHTFSSIQPRLAIKPCARRVATCTKTGARPSKGSAPHGSAAARKRAAFPRRAGGAAVAFQKIAPIASPRRAARDGRRARRSARHTRRAGAARPQKRRCAHLHSHPPDIAPTRISPQTTAGKQSPRWPLP